MAVGWSPEGTKSLTTSNRRSRRGMSSGMRTTVRRGYDKNRCSPGTSDYACTIASIIAIVCLRSPRYRHCVGRSRRPTGRLADHHTGPSPGVGMAAPALPVSASLRSRTHALTGRRERHATVDAARHPVCDAPPSVGNAPFLVRRAPLLTYRELAGRPPHTSPRRGAPASHQTRCTPNAPRTKLASHQARLAPSPPRTKPASHRTWPHSQPRSLAIFMASTRLWAPVLPIALDR